MQIPKIPLFHSQTASLSTSRMTNEELKKKVNNHGYVLPENSYQFKYPVCTNTHLNNSSPKPFMKAGGFIQFNYLQIFKFAFMGKFRQPYIAVPILPTTYYLPL